jgi:hypothetical protein
MNDNEWMEQFENATLPNESFHHADHVKMAFLYLQKYPPLEALQRFSCSLKNFAGAHGKSDRYNETVTWAFLLLIRERLGRAGYSQSWSEFAANNQDLLHWQDHILKKYYRAETLGSPLAKNIFLFPDNL